jgi:hypothetical protein
MFQRLLDTSPREIWKWLLYALLLLAPGSFVILAAIGVVRHCVRTQSPLLAGRPWYRQLSNH